MQSFFCLGNVVKPYSVIHIVFCLGNAVKLQLYALFKQSTVGACTGKRPGMTDFVGRAKWDAWNALGQISKEEAEKKYIDCINELVGAETPSAGIFTKLLPNLGIFVVIDIYRAVV